MTEVERIVDQLDRAITAEAWHGPALLEILEDVRFEQASARPISGGHSIWELTLHISAWLDAGRRRLAGERAQLTDAEDWPAVPAITNEAWANTKAAIRKHHQELRSAIATLSDSHLEQPIIPGMSSTYVTLHGVIQHTLYHAGQIAILKKALAEE